MQVLIDNYDLVLRAFGYNLLLFVLSGVGSLALGTLLAAMRVGPVSVLRAAAVVYVNVVRNTPLLLILLFMRFGAPKAGISFGFVDVRFGDIRLNNLFAAAVVSLTVYTSAFVCEAIRSGVNAVPLGQAEAARAIGLPFGGVMTQVVLPQAIRATVPPLASTMIALLKNTSVAGAAGVFEAFIQLRGFLNDFPGARVELFLGVALIFVVLVEILSFAANRLERRWRIA